MGRREVKTYRALGDAAEVELSRGQGREPGEDGSGSSGVLHLDGMDG